MDYKKILEEELEKLDWEIEQLERKVKLLEPLAEEDEELKLELIGTKALLSLYKADRQSIVSALA
ncbi:hypothetical protein IPA_03635 [Ignicoccus pacificus DSM 13166]|uniref:Uncharacterized protein n=1 Tax=Ignicoccus pacificus DSM 13166 TaxID=940294 RepID=A0A977PLB7_9CREN|nr:hypothetical protein IPA_03635 [Ignicoccus pacificus DSM 13166]